MKRRLSKYSYVLLNLLVAVAVSLVVNFSYLLLLLVDQRNDAPPPPPEEEVRKAEPQSEGVLRVVPDGHGYLLFENGDSVYVTSQRIRRLGLRDGDLLVAEISAPASAEAHPVMEKVLRRNGEEFDYGALFKRPAESVVLTLQLVYYLLLSFILLSILTPVRYRYSRRRFIVRSGWCIAVAVGLYFLAPVTEWKTGRLLFNFMAPRMLDYVLLLKCSFAVVVSILYGWIYVLISQQQAVEMENERLKNENLTTRYDMLVGQINPHFFFNSLNSLSMLVREKLDEKALTYIDQLSYTFRYIIQNGQNTLITLGEELDFIEAYGYLFKIRYADKFFFDVDVPDAYRAWVLPALSLQPLVGNAVKHNAITRSNPLRISVRVVGQWLEISNPKAPKLEPEPSMGIGLANLRSRVRLITGRDIEIVDTAAEFTVRVPLQNPAACSEL
ncbi:MAG: histidine kinase [Alistipes sp.]|nr:histidine kinase [Alistipes senegalensis]MCM1250441.1 histidine kinase [Alistipes sp.]